MKLRIAYSFSILLAFLLSSCTSRSDVPINKEYADFPQEQELKAKVIPLDSALFRYPFRLHIGDDKVVALDLHGTDYFFHAFSYPDFHYLSSFGKRGDAPQHMLSAENIRWNGAFWWTLDANKSELTRFEFALSGDSLLRQEAVKLDKDILRPLDLVICDDATFIIPDYSGDNRFCRVDKNGKLLNKFGTIPSSNEEALQSARPALAQAWRSFIDYNPHNGVLAVVTQLGEVLEIYNLKDSTHVVRIGPHGEPEFQISGGYGIPTGIMGFSDVQVTDKAIYAVFHGISFKDIARNAQNNVKMEDGGRYIYVFSLTGEPLMKYALDHSIYGISVDEQSGVIYATDVNKDEPIIEYRFHPAA